MSHSALSVAETNRSQGSVVRVTPPLLPRPSQTALPLLLVSRPISSRTHRRRAVAAGKPPPAANISFGRPSPTVRKPRPTRSPRLLIFRQGTPPIQFVLYRSNTPPMWPHLLYSCLVHSLQTHLDVPASQPLSRRYHLPGGFIPYCAVPSAPCVPLISLIYKKNVITPCFKV